MGRRNMDVYMRDYDTGGPVPFDIVGTPSYTLQKDEVADERVVVFAARAMREVLQHPPDARLKEKLQKTLKDLPGLQDELKTLIARIGVHCCHPATVLAVLETMGPKVKIFEEMGWIVTQAEKAPGINHIAVLGLALEAHHLNRPPVAVVQALKALEAEARFTRGATDPLAMLQSLNKVSRHDFDGTWTWHNGLGHMTHPDGFTIHGHHVRFNTPELHPCTLRDICYEEDGLRFVMLREGLVADEQSTGSESTRVVEYTVQLCRTATGCTGKWMCGQSHEVWVPSRFELTGPPPVTPTCDCEWGAQATSSVFPELAQRISVWGCEWLHQKEIRPTMSDACTTIRTIFPNLQVGTDDLFYGPILRLWEACCKQVVEKASTEMLLPVLDTWVLATSPGKSLADLCDLRMHAATILLKAYISQRPVRWHSVPVSLTKLHALKTHYSVLDAFVDSVTHESELLQNNLNTRKVSACDFDLMQEHTAIHTDNNVVFPSNLDQASFRVAQTDLVTMLHLCRELMEHWGVLDDTSRMRDDIEYTVRVRDTVDLCDLESTVKLGKRTLGAAWDIQDAVTSPLLRAHFLASPVGGGTTTLRDMPRVFDHLKQSLSKFTLDTPIGIATACMDPTEGHLQGERKRQELNLLLELGVTQEIAKSLVDGALPLRHMVNGLESFRTLADDKKCPRDLRLQPHFFNEKEKSLLLDADMDTTKLGDAADRAQAIREVSGGCKPEALEIISTMLKCEKIVEFTREHPQAQDEGLASVLSNTRDLQHASFQTLLNCVSYINPFVTASLAHHNCFAERTKELEEERAEAGLEGKPTVDEVVRCASLRAPINNRTSLDSRTPDGFWDMLNKQFANDVVVRQIQANLERINTADQVGSLEKMMDEQTGTTDRLISHCRAAAGMPPAATHDADGDATDVRQEAALVVVDLPPTGTPSLRCEFGGVMKSGPEYQDIVYRATLQWNLDDALDEFRVQAREVLRAFNTACVLFGEGHIEFRSRRITFRHNEGGKVSLMLRSLVGQWAAVSAGQVSVLHEACKQDPALACLTPAELMRMAELLRGVSSSGDLTQEEAHRMVLPWRGTRTRPLRRGQQVAVPTSEVLEAAQQEMRPQPTPCHAVRLPQRNPLPDDPHPLQLTGCGVADGEYRKGLYTYARADGAALVPVSNGWSVYSKPQFDGQQLLASCSEHDSSLEPWGMDGWVEPDQHGLLSCSRSPVRVQIDAAHAVFPNWSCDGRPLLRRVLVRAPGGTNVPDLEVTESETGEGLLVGGVLLESLWGSLGFERGMRIVSVRTDAGDELKGNREMIDFFKNSGSTGGATKHAKQGFVVEVQGPWVWDTSAAPSQMDISENGCSITKVRGEQPSIAFCGAAGTGCTWRVLLEGDVQGARVGLCRPNIDFRVSEADTGSNKGLAYWYLRAGVLRHDARDVSLTEPFKSGDVITVTHSQQQRRISFKLNDVELCAMFTDVDVDAKDLHPCVYLKERGCTATICNGAPTTEVLKWNATRATQGLSTSGFVVEVQGPWVWDTSAAPSQMDISENRCSITKLRGEQPSIAFCVAAGTGCTWRVLLEGHVQGARVGLCRPEIDFCVSEADTGSNKGLAYWYLRGGLLRHDARDVSLTEPFQSGDVITVTHSQRQRRISFKLNDVELCAMFTNVDVDGKDLHPCVYLKERGCTATICNGDPTTKVLKWNVTRIDSESIDITNDGRTISKRAGTTAAGAVGNTVFHGPGPHKFQVSLKVHDVRGLHIGVAPPGVDLKEMVKAGFSFFGMTVMDNGSVYNLQEPGIVATTARVSGMSLRDQTVTYEFTIDLGEGTVDVLRDQRRLVHTARLHDFPRPEGPLVPYVFFDGTDPRTEVTLLEEEVPAVQGTPAVVIRGTHDAKSKAAQPRKGAAQEWGPADGLYERHTPTYIRQDGRFQVFHWNGRWCVADPSDRPVAFSSAVDPKLDLGSRSLKWTTVRGFQAVPEAVRVVTPVQPGGILNKQDGMRGGKVWYANRTHMLFWSEVVRRWVITDIGVQETASSVHAYYSSHSPAELPHCCTAWYWGNGTSWSTDMHLRIAPCCKEVPLKKDSRSRSEAEFGAGWDVADDAVVSVTELRPVADIETHVCPAGAPDRDVDTMSPDELAGCHIINKARGMWVTGRDLRRALVKAAEGADSGTELRADWRDAEDTKQSVRRSALCQLRRIGELLRQVQGSRTDCCHLIRSFDESGPGYARVLGRTLKGGIVDTSRMAVADRKLFGLSLLEREVRAYHVLDCTEATLEEDVAAFVSLFQHLEEGRMVVLNLQALHSESRNLIRACIEGNRSTVKEMLAVVTGGDGTDETVDIVDTMCDMAWKMRAMNHAAMLNGFRSITCYTQDAGTGKTFAIEAELVKGTWGNGATATRLDLDSTTDSLCEVCQRLMDPLRRAEGVLLVHVGHDTKPSLANQVLDSLIFLGRIQSNSGLSASLPPNGWHLVVEFQHPPEKGVGHEVNVPWIRPDGTSQMTVLACQGLASRASCLSTT